MGAESETSLKKGRESARAPLRGPTLFLLACTILALAGILALGAPLAMGMFETFSART
jgi:hypothetical protein